MSGAITAYLRRREGQTYELGVATMRILISAEDTEGRFSLAEFRGNEGPWTVPHVHRLGSEAFFVLDGGFTFTVAGETIEAGPGDFVHVPADTEHVLGGLPGGGTVLVAWSPGGLERMFVELSQLPRDAIVDPGVRAKIAARHDSHPA